MLLRIEVTDENGATRTLRFAQQTVTIGSAADCDVVLAKQPGMMLAAYHTRVERVTRGRCKLARANRGVETLVNGQPITEAIVQPTDLVAIACYKLAIRTEYEDPREADLLAAIARRDDHARAVYADWLESKGDSVRAELVRLQSTVPAPADPEPPARERLRELARQADVEWRTELSCAPIEQCGRDGCPGDWSALATTEELTVRDCTACQKSVRYCSNVFEAASHVLSGGSPVVVDDAHPRRPGDLDRALSPPPPTMNPPAPRR